MNPMSIRCFANFSRTFMQKARITRLKPFRNASFPRGWAFASRSSAIPNGTPHDIFLTAFARNAMPDPRFLLIRLGSMGDVIHALPAAAALREAFPAAGIDWAIEPKWQRLLEGNPDINEVIPIDRKSAAGIFGTIRKLRATRYDAIIDFQALYKSAILAYASGAPKRIGFQRAYAREGFAANFYTERLNPSGPHKVDHNLTLARHAGARNSTPRFPLSIQADDEEIVSRELAAHGIGE